eukprot:gene35239-45633_t
MKNLQGKGTSGTIMKLQTSALRFFTKIDCDFLNAPFKFEGEQDAEIQQFYPDAPYYDWCPDQGLERNNLEVCPISPQVHISIQLILERIKTGSFDGLLSFSQGASLCARVLSLLESEGNMYNIKAAVFIAGVNPKDWPEPDKLTDLVLIRTPSLHIHGLEDSRKPRSQRLQEYFEPSTRIVLSHSEGHNVPSIRTKLYPVIKDWIYKTAMVE